MFNGIIHNKGTLKSKSRTKNSSIIEIYSSLKFSNKEIGSSISCNGACLTLTKILGKNIFFYLSNETLARTNFKKMKIGKSVNIEKSLFFGKSISGQYTQGHVDTTGIVKNIFIYDKAWKVRIFIGKKNMKFIVDKCSITINGVSLTVSKVLKDSFEISIVPHTIRLTNLDELKIKDLVNIEFDIFSKYLLKLTK